MSVALAGSSAATSTPEPSSARRATPAAAEASTATAESSTTGRTSSATAELARGSSGSLGPGCLGPGEFVGGEEIFGVHEEDLSLLEVLGIDSINRLDAEEEGVEGAEDLVDGADLGLVLEVDSAVELGEAGHIGALEDKTVLRLVEEGGVGHDVRGRPEVHLPGTPARSSSAGSSAETASASSLVEPAPGVPGSALAEPTPLRLLVELFPHCNNYLSFNTAPKSFSIHTHFKLSSPTPQIYGLILSPFSECPFLYKHLTLHVGSTFSGRGGGQAGE